MRRVAIAACLALAFVNGATAINVADQFAQFKIQYGRKYASVQEEARRFRIFAQNLERAAALQASNPGATFGVNEFADLSAHEFKRRHNADHYYQRRLEEAEPVMAMDAAAKLRAQGRAVDWRTKGAVTPVKNQGDCGSCWSFSTTGGIEGQWFLAGNPLTSLSEQELVSCDTIDSGCNGGLMDNAFTWLLTKKNGSIVTETSYPYVSGSGAVPTCSLSGKQFGASISSYKNIEKTEDAMAAFVFASGPLSIAVDATSWQSYTGGIMSNCISQQLDHGVLIVGFDDTNNPPYWIIKNSWGRTWGEAGYIRVQKGTNQCLLTSAPCTSIVAQNPNTPAPGPGPSPSSATFIQSTCIDQSCKQCTSMTLPQNECITASHSSFLASCATDGLIVTAFGTRNCTGPSQITVNPINTCSVVFRQTGDERFVQNICPATTPAPTQAPPTPAPTGAPPTPAPTPAPPTPAPTFPSGWIDLFPPPYQNAPSIMMAIAALNNATQYVPGGSNGAGFDVFEFNGEENGQFTPLTMPDQALMIMALAAGGTTENPKGVVGGFGIGNGIQYFVNATTLLPSKIPTLLVTTQDARMSRDGTNALVVDGSGSNNVLFSSDSGKTFNEKLVNISVNPNCTNVRYGAMASASTYYVTFASWPNTQARRKSKTSYQLSETRFAERQANGKLKIRRRLPKRVGSGVGSGSSSQGGGCPYAAAIAKTTDGGNTWTAQVNIPNGNFYFNGIDCFGANHCIAVGEGFNEGAGGHIWLTEDGTNWKQVFFMPSTSAGQYSFMSVMFSGSTGKEAWVGGSLQISQVAAKGLFFHTSDGGKTWKEYPHGLPNLGDITSLSMLPDGKGFATAITIYDDSTILRYDPNGPPPPGYFKQLQCSAANCTGICQNSSFPQAMCLQLNNGGSAIATCTSTALVQQVFQTGDCTGSSTSSSMPLNVCQTSDGSSFETFCPSSQQDPEFADLPPRGKRFLRA